ncbi:MAG: lipoyl(octanoyl) transferase LipB [Kofleriaceae bacterium]|nr:lipoyl(octanoyl) transferase LipB [Kofleriaceae bacterium]
MIAWHWLGNIEYRLALRRQLAWRDEVLAGSAPGAVLMCEHPPVITLGRSATTANVLTTAGELATDGVAVERIERGGDVTYHGPGQLMVYPVVRVRSVIGLLEIVAHVLIESLAQWGVANAQWRRDPAGIWVGDAKIAACGIHVARGVVTHGFALNLATPASAWRHIRPCGLGTPVISVAQALAAGQATQQCEAPSAAAAAIVVGSKLVAALPTVVR